LRVLPSAHPVLLSLSGGPHISDGPIFRGQITGRKKGRASFWDALPRVWFPGRVLLSRDAVGHSTIGAEGLNCRVRDGNGCFTLAMATGNYARRVGRVLSSDKLNVGIFVGEIRSLGCDSGLREGFGVAIINSESAHPRACSLRTRP